MDTSVAHTRARVLVVEDDAALSDVVCTFLSDEGYACVPAFSGTEALLLAERAAGQKGSAGGFGLVILDLMLPGVSGEELIGRLRELLGAVPIVVTSAKSELADRVGVLRLGADDYLVKPFDLDELLARVEVQLRRVAPASVPGELRCDNWVLDLERRAFLVDGEELRLTRTEFDILAALMSQPGRVFTKRDLFERVRDEEALSEERTIATHVGNLRAKLRASGTDGRIETVWGIGFKLRA